MLLLSLLLYIIIIIIVLRARGVAFVNTKPFLHLVLSYGEIARKWQYRMSINMKVILHLFIAARFLLARVFEELQS